MNPLCECAVPGDCPDDSTPGCKLVEGKRSSLFADAPNGETVALVALTLAFYGDATNSKLSDLIPQPTWDWLYGSGFIRSGRDITDEGYVDTTREGRDALLAWAETVSE